jgi:hypothetical protein
MLFFRWLYVGVQGTCRIHQLWLRLLSISTDINRASLDKVPYFSIKSTQGLWHWFQLRRHLLQHYFPLDYSLNSTPIGACIIATIFFVAQILFVTLILGGDPSGLGIVVGVTWSLACLKTIYAVAAIWKEQQLHVNVLQNQIVLCNAAKMNALGHLLQGQQPEVQNIIDHIFFVKHLMEDIEEEDAPKILGIPVKPAFFYVLLSYFAAAALSLGAKYFSEVFT